MGQETPARARSLFLNRCCARLGVMREEGLKGLRIPIVQAPMAGGPSTPALVREVGAAGGMGFLAAGYKTAEAMRQEIAEVRRTSAAPFGVNLFVPQPRSEEHTSELQSREN